MKINLQNPMLITIVLAVGLTTFEKIIPQIIYLIYAYPAAFLASLFLGSHPILTETGEILIPLAGHSINVIPACSAYGFFCLLYAMVVSHSFHRFNKKKAVLFSILAVPIIFGITVLTNSSRIVSAYYVNEMGRILLPSNFQAALHQGVGIVLFLSVIMGMHLLLERIFHYEFKR